MLQQSFLCLEEKRAKRNRKEKPLQQLLNVFSLYNSGLIRHVAGEKLEMGSRKLNLRGDVFCFFLFFVLSQRKVSWQHSPKGMSSYISEFAP